MASPAFLHPYAKPSKPAENFVTIVRGEGSTLWDKEGKSYLDGMASLWYCNAGYGQTRITEAITAQLQALPTYNTFDPWTNEPTELLAEKIRSVAPMPDARVFFTQSGSEAIDSALKLARMAQIRAGQPERQLIVSRTNGYHGVTYGGVSVQGIPLNKDGWGQLLPGFEQLPNNDLEAMSVLFSQRGNEICAVVAEPIQGAGGVNLPAPGYLPGLRRLCDDHGALLIFDEVICAWGRLGQWFGGQHFGVVPDMITFAKAVTSGYQPLGGVILGAAAHEPLATDPSFMLRHGHTYSGHPACTAAGLATLSLYEQDGLFERASLIGKVLSEGLRSLAEDGVISGYRGDQAIWAAELFPGVDNFALRDRMLELGVISRPLGTPAAPAMAFCPPLVMTEVEAARMIDALAVAAAEFKP